MKAAPRARPRAAVIAEAAADRWAAVEDAQRAMLEAARRPSRKRSVANAWAAMVRLRREGMPITAASVGRLCEQADPPGPKAQSIRNDPGGLLKLVTLAAACATVAGRRTRPGETMRDLADRVADPQAAAEVRVVIAERDAFERRCAMLMGSHRRVAPLGRITMEMATGKVETLEDLGSRIEERLEAGGLRFSEAEATAVADLIRAFGPLRMEFDEASGELYRTSPSGSMREVKGDLRSVLRKIIVAGLPSGVPEDVAGALGCTSSKKAA